MNKQAQADQIVENFRVRKNEIQQAISNLKDQENREFLRMLEDLENLRYSDPAPLRSEFAATLD